LGDVCFSQPTVNVFVLKDQDSYTEFEKEASVLHKLSHPSITLLTLKCLYSSDIVQFLGTFNNGKETYIVTEFMALGNVLDLLKNDNDRKITVADLTMMARQAASGMTYLASKNIVHRDLALSK
jgi:serine/threonine protein kinase